MRCVSPVHAIRGVLFDKDGTLLDYWKTWVPINRQVALAAAGGDAAIAAQLLRAGGHDPETDIVAAGSALAGGGVAEIAEIFSGILGARTPRDLEGVIDRGFRDGGALTAVAIDGAHDVVARLKATGLVVGVATNDTWGGLEASLGRVGLLSAFDFLVASDSGHGVKPEPGMVHAFAGHTRLGCDAIAVVGDSVHDLEMAARAGAGLAVAVLSGTSRREDLAPSADAIIDSVAELPALLGH